MNRRFNLVVTPLLLAVLAVVMTGMVLAQEPAEPATPSRGLVREDAEPEPTRAAPAVKRYGRQWAVIVGINYTDSKLSDADRRVVPALANAENDARAIAQLLMEHYGYARENVRLLLGKDATQAAILSAIGDDFLRNPQVVTDQDSVLFFFAGHGVHLEKERRSGEIIPWDVRVVGQIPAIESCIKLQSITEDYLKNSPARHKLIVLDSCYSGDVFTQTRQAYRASTATVPADSGLFYTPALQAIASCRNNQQASDGKGGRSPFSSALTTALTVIPRRQGTLASIRARDLFTFMQDELRAAPSVDQSADLGWLTPEQGEFHFFPQGDFSGYSDHTDDEMLKAIAMAPGTYGAWWFEEMPWFLPSLRARILANVEQPRGTAADWVRKHQLEESAREILRQLENEPGELAQLRLRHLQLLLDPATRQNPDEAYRTIAAELRQVPPGVTLEAADLHLLAVVEHRLGHSARDAYRNAVQAYDQGLKKGRRQDAALQMLCFADLGQFEFQENDYEQAAVEYRRALEQRVLCPVPFQIFVLCSEADAWQQLGRWGEANAKLDQALQLAFPLSERTPESPLTAFVYTRRAWAAMEQWKFHDAAREFLEARACLPKAGQDRESAIVEFHNRHGLAMARRFTGDPEGALADYRRISIEIRQIFSQMRADAGIERNYGEVRERLAQRLSNTLERQADCNLFRENGDMKEAADDLRRAIRVTEYLPVALRNRTKAVQLYKQVLALSRRSPYQDLDVAAAILRAADELTEQLGDEQQRRLDYYRQIAGSVHQMAVAINAADDESGGPASRREKRLTACASLRSVISDLRPRLNRSIHRDHLELLMFASQYLLTEEQGVAERYHLLGDSELLLALCRHAIRSEPLVTQRYLRHYFDTVVRTMLAARPTHVQGLIEAVFEARMGRHYDKAEIPVPSLVMYQLDGRFHAFLDAPQGISKVYLLDEGVTLDTLREAESAQKLLTLPRQLRDDLARLQLERACFPESLTAPVEDAATCLHVRWHDGFYLLGTSSHKPVVSAPGADAVQAVVTRKETTPITNFPFALPGLPLIPVPASPPAATNVAQP
ncbi:MAG: caspase family protein [Pirellulales bacterium]